MRVLITGGAGLIGRYLARELVTQGHHEVIPLDLPAAFTPMVQAMLPGISWALASGVDICDTRRLDRCFDHFRPEVVVHLAAVLGVKNTDTNPGLSAAVNVGGTANVINACKRFRVEHFIFASSSEVYGAQTEPGPIDEHAELLGESVYAHDKMLGEQMTRFETHGMYTIVRFFNTYGPGQVAQFALPRWINQVRAGFPPTVYANGLGIRSFCYVEDIARDLAAIVRIRPLGHVFNLGNDTPISLRGAAQEVCKAACYNPNKLKYTAWEDADRPAYRDILVRVPNIRKSHDLLGSSRRIDLTAGLKHVMRGPTLPAVWPYQVSDATWGVTQDPAGIRT